MSERFVGITSNEGRIRFMDRGYEAMIRLDDIASKDYRRTVRDIERTFQRVARQEMEAHNKAVDRGEKKRRIPLEEMPGLTDGDVVVAPFSKCLLPTTLISTEPYRRRDGSVIVRGFKEVRINENFVKALTQLRDCLQGDEGAIHAYPTEAKPRVIGELYSSILHSVALHAIRGLFPINEWGFATYGQSGRVAQGERGRRWRYVNVLAILFYWVLFVERYEYPRKRVETFLDEYPELFRGLSHEEKRRLPPHLLRQCSNMLDRKAFPFPLTVEKTGMTAEDVERVLEDRAG